MGLMVFDSVFVIWLAFAAVAMVVVVELGRRLFAPANHLLVDAFGAMLKSSESSVVSGAAYLGMAGYVGWSTVATLVCLVGAICELASWRVDDHMAAPLGMGVVAWLFGI